MVAAHLGALKYPSRGEADLMAEAAMPRCTVSALLKLLQWVSVSMLSIIQQHVTLLTLPQNALQLRERKYPTVQNSSQS